MIRRFGLIAILLVWAAGGAASAQNIRVRLLGHTSPTSISIEGVTHPVELFAADYEDPLTQIEPGQPLTISVSADQLHVETAEIALFARSLRVDPKGEGELEVAITEGDARPDPRRYTGSIHVSLVGDRTELELVNVVDLEEYVASVVASEYGFDDLEGAKAMAVLARTYALSERGKFGDRFDHVDNTRSQMYLGSGAVTPITQQAARETAGEVLTYDGELVHAVYFSSSGGHTADNEAVWDGRPLPYLRGKSDPYSASSPHSDWNVRIPRGEMLEHLSRTFRTEVDGFIIDQRSSDGRVESIELLLAAGGSRIVGGNEFRLAVTGRFGVRSLRSTLFDARRDGDSYVFSGRGFGHGVGLSQWGAHEMAERGMKYEEILAFYYTDVQLAMLDPDLLSPDRQTLADLPEPEVGGPPSSREPEIAEHRPEPPSEPGTERSHREQDVSGTRPEPDPRRAIEQSTIDQADDAGEVAVGPDGRNGTDSVSNAPTAWGKRTLGSSGVSANAVDQNGGASTTRRIGW